MIKIVERMKVAASRFATGAEFIACSSIYSKAYTEGSDPFDLISMARRWKAWCTSIFAPIATIQGMKMP